MCTSKPLRLLVLLAIFACCGCVWMAYKVYRENNTSILVQHDVFPVHGSQVTLGGPINVSTNKSEHYRPFVRNTMRQLSDEVRGGETAYLRNTTNSLVHSHNVQSESATTSDPKSVFKAWERGVVTQLWPKIDRNCDSLRANDYNAKEGIKKQLRSWNNSGTEEEFVERMSDCSHVINEFSSNFYVSQEEMDFPLAFVFVISSNIRQVVRLLKVVYRPHNIYCIHPDARQDEQFHKVFHQISRCLDNVFIASKVYKVYYAHHTIMDAELSCMEDLLQYDSSRWRYSINVCGTELPLKTNRELVRDLKALKGANAVLPEGILGGYFSGERLRWKLALNETAGRVYYTKERLPPAPHGITVYKGAHFCAITRPFIHFILTNKKARDFRVWLNGVFVPEEEFFVSLSRLPEAPGGIPHGMTIKVDEYIWMYPGYPRRHCEGRIVRGVCILSSGDLDLVFQLGVDNRRPTFFFNKYYMDDDHVVMDCMEEWLIQQNKLEYTKDHAV